MNLQSGKRILTSFKLIQAHSSSFKKVVLCRSGSYADPIKHC